MSTPHLSRYPRPLKATRTFSGGCHGLDGATDQFAANASSRRSLSPPNFSSYGLPSTGSAAGRCSGTGGVWSEDISTTTSVEARVETECRDGEFLQAVQACLSEESCKWHGSMGEWWRGYVGVFGVPREVVLWT